MRLLIFFFICLLLNDPKAFGQETDIDKPYIKEMRWELNKKIYLELFNDSNYILSIDNLYHSDATYTTTTSDQFTYYPVSFGQGFIQKIMEQEKAKPDSTNSQSTTYITLWGELHSDLGGGWAHFINCLLYSLESGQLSLNSPLMKRPKSKWKPKPPTESYLHTKKWEYYIPLNQKLAHKEYDLRKENNNLNDLEGVPEDFINLFLSTKQKDYQKLRKDGKRKEYARIDLVKILLGAKYLGEAQIKFIKSTVLKAAMQYSVYNLPSIIIMNEFNAAVAMSLNEEGYHIDKIIFNDENIISEKEMKNRTEKIHQVISQINKTNKKQLEKKLMQYFGKSY